MTEAEMMERCQGMKEQKQKMKEDMKTQDAQLTEQFSKMNRALEDKKIGLMVFHEECDAKGFRNL